MSWCDRLVWDDASPGQPSDVVPELRGAADPAAAASNVDLVTEQGSSSATAAGVKVGLCGWTIAQASYVHRFPLVEVQHTFYEPPADALLARWRAGVPRDFEFTIKA